MRHFEDFTVGDRFDLGTVSVNAEQIIAFATEFDPQPFHVDTEVAADGPFGGLVASGWHTVALFMRRYVDVVLTDAASLGSPGVESLRWLAPVRPDMLLHGWLEVVDGHVSERDPRRGTLILDCGFDGDDGEPVLRFRARGMFARRDA